MRRQPAHETTTINDDVVVCSGYNWRDSSSSSSLLFAGQRWVSRASGRLGRQLKVAVRSIEEWLSSLWERIAATAMRHRQRPPCCRRQAAVRRAILRLEPAATQKTTNLCWCARDARRHRFNFVCRSSWSIFQWFQRNVTLQMCVAAQKGEKFTIFGGGVQGRPKSSMLVPPKSSCTTSDSASLYATVLTLYSGKITIS